MKSNSKMPPVDLFLDESFEPEIIFNELKKSLEAKIKEQYPDFKSISPADPLFAALKVFVNRELNIRARVNHVAKTYLDKLVELSRLTALQFGSKSYYESILLSLKIEDKEVFDSVSLEAGVNGIITIYGKVSSKHQKAKEQTIKDAIDRELRDKKTLNDRFLFKAAKPKDFKLKAKLTPRREMSIDLSKIESDFINAFNQFNAIGQNISLAWIIANLYGYSVANIQIETPSNDFEVLPSQWASLESIELEGAK